MTVQLTVSDIGRASDPTATEITLHTDPHAARTALFAEFGPHSIRGDETAGTVGGMTGRVFQASKSWTIRDVGKA